jgi:hypothetical protein
MEITVVSCTDAMNLSVRFKPILCPFTKPELWQKQYIQSVFKKTSTPTYLRPNQGMYEKNLMNWEYEQKCMSVAGKCPT